MTKKSKSKSKKPKQYEPQYLLIILAVVLLLEGFLMGSAEIADWQSGLSMLDMSSAISEAVTDTIVVMQPVVDAIKTIDTFYQESATAMTELLSLPENPFDQILQLTEYTNSFYESAAEELTTLLDLSSFARASTF
ncbi:MAG: hypothetical protein A3I07_02005 [Candidatus Doudnabacteria bacterium RIFCSPLOWO2_02_FULL_42_9]|uniref:Uncharacterized protein n=1 Tax=Candidatus Doudnabacteria bacterium RIFCSPHIGHO2_01_FULL_41_86 TaxID=1817821 RepID=A0A1F5N8E4_9BACT|nr:MAG: hypothetical protein A2717_03650 [Candidatus Doudnabacteria bacterium RIFCSPHIGHO2_01_FULL_41_86]OGE74769.1 MAG: hypothetical protein A3K07_03245 [Candidatus Doudnabacteria bacterium RIFCSPHIGHO2_01_43_10]OGE85736.1 MAG: hypothetical protein A3E28_02980 [Candidatus Doudnabacteria bacterium RIFCSPHIGHO2_12_FULL_42_22]OGE87232.1 MAG: hypothetical protein A3C49_00610 [Candidatus Doudnabacteria bacterium RIFCSPHIGHO2_02_FULL_42_25]OGE92069.1 MAG: hypothetical protein A2895_00485 [Candidatus